MSLQNKLQRIILDLEELEELCYCTDEKEEIRKIIDNLNTLYLTEPLI